MLSVGSKVGMKTQRQIASPVLSEYLNDLEQVTKDAKATSICWGSNAPFSRELTDQCIASNQERGISQRGRGGVELLLCSLQSPEGMVKPWQC